MDTDIVSARQDFKLSLRKQKIDDYFMAKRLSELKLRNKAVSPLEVNPDMLILSEEIRNRVLNDIVKKIKTERLDDFYKRFDHL